MPLAIAARDKAICSLFACLMLALASPTDALAQTAERGLPPAPTFRPQVGQVGSDTYLVTSSANEKGSFLWAVDPVQHTVTLCQQAEPGKAFTCSRQPLP